MSKKKLRIGFIGNFIPQFSTESDRKWTFENMGHTVIPFQENLTTKHDLIQALPTLDVLFYSHTHDPSYVIPDLVQVFNLYKIAGVPTVSVHLDRWAGLERVKDVGVEATWFTEYIFMADASPEAVELYDKHHLNWYYLKPGVIERDCYLDEHYDEKNFMYDVIFVGSKGYHPEYPFRSKLVEFLEETYGDTFGHYGNDGLGVARGEALNRLYAVSKIAVGDSCFGGRPNYVSDRYYETRGRGGFLLHPHVEGVDHVGVAPYTSESLEDLKTQIDYWLAHDVEREIMRAEGFEQVKNHETYTNRAQEMLDIIFKA